jgi:hypothetical protein
MRSLLLLLLLFASPLLRGAGHSSAIAQPPARADQVQAVRLVQEHYFLGPIVLTVCQNAVHLDCTKHMGFALVSRAPDWTVTVFRDDDKTIKSLRLKQFESMGMMPQFLQTSRPRMVPSAAAPFSFKFYGFDARRVTNPYQTQEYLTLPGVAAPQVERIVFAAYRLPTGGGLPVRYIGTASNRDFFSGKDVRGQKQTNLTTSSAKHVMVSPDLFTAPKNYRTASMMQEVAVSSRTRAQSADFQNVFDIANPKKIEQGKPAK